MCAIPTMWIGDELPQCILHKIFSGLSHENAAKASGVSKTWLQAWFTYPNLKFKVDYDKGNNNRKLVDNVMERYRERKTPIEKFELWISSSVYHQVLAFPCTDKWLAIALQNGVKHLVCNVSGSLYPFPISTFLASKTLRELNLEGCDLMNLSLSTSTSQLGKCHSLRKLSLCDVRVDDNMFQTLVHCCPLIVYLMISSCCLLTNNTTERSSFKIQSPTLEHLSYFHNEALLDVTECKNLKSLHLLLVTISEECLRHLISTCQVLEILVLDLVCGELNERLNICRSPSLKDLCIRYCNDIGDIDASNLVSLEHVGIKIPEHKISKESGQLKKSQTYFRFAKDLINAAWFCKLRKFLSNLTSWSHVSLRFDECNYEINMKDLQLHPSVVIPQVIVLDVHMKNIDVRSYSSFVDALLWSCHPRRLNLFSTREVITCCLMYMKNSTFHGSKPWHSQLKQVKAYKFDSPVELSSEEENMDSIYFLLDW